MIQPVYRSALLAVAVLTGVVRLATGGPLLRRRAVPLSRAELLLAAIALVVRVLQSASMFFALRRVWWPGVLLLAVPLAGVGYTMSWPHPLPTHPAWLAAAVPAAVAVAAPLVGGRGSGSGARRIRRPRPAIPVA